MLNQTSQRARAIVFLGRWFWAALHRRPSSWVSDAGGSGVAGWDLDFLASIKAHSYQRLSPQLAGSGLNFPQSGALSESESRVARAWAPPPTGRATVLRARSPARLTMGVVTETWALSGHVKRRYPLPPSPNLLKSTWRIANGERTPQDPALWAGKESER